MADHRRAGQRSWLSLNTHRLLRHLACISTATTNKAALPCYKRCYLQLAAFFYHVAPSCPPHANEQAKASHGVRPGDVVACCVLPPPPLEAAPEALPLDIVYEDEHLIVINKVRYCAVPTRYRRAVWACWYSSLALWHDLCFVWQ
jgi:hypothetical protein